MNNTMYKLLIPVMAICLLTSCGSSKKAQGVPGETEIVQPCVGPEYQTSNDFFRASQNGLSTDMATAKMKALTTTQALLATTVEAMVKRVNESYTSSYQSGEQEEMKSRYNDLTMIVVKQTLRDTRIICEKMMRTTDGKYRCYLAVETSKEAVLNAIGDKLKNDERLRTDFEYERYKKVFNEEMDKLDGN